MTEASKAFNELQVLREGGAREAVDTYLSTVSPPESDVERLRQARLLYNTFHPGMGWPDWDNLTPDIMRIYYDEIVAREPQKPTKQDSHDLRAARRQIKELNKINARQGRTICALRGDVARVREESHKIDRGDLRRLERDQATLLEELRKGLVVIGKLRERLREAKALEMPVTEAGIQHDG